MAIIVSFRIVRSYKTIRNSWFSDIELFQSRLTKITGMGTLQIQKQIAAMTVGTRALINSKSGLIPSFPKEELSNPYPAGLGALAMTVNPPPTTAPATKA